MTGVACAEQYVFLIDQIPQKVFRIFDSGFDIYADVSKNMQE